MQNISFKLEGETFSVREKKGEGLFIPTAQEINEKYRKGEMRIVTEQGRINLDSIAPLLDSEQGGKRKYILNPEYQRRKRWSNKQKSLLIESFIMNVPIPPIFLYEVEYAVYEVMDGLQRLTAIYDFYQDKFALESLEYWEELNGYKYSELPENVRGGIDRRYLSSIILLEETAKSKEEAEYLKQIVFERLNSGGEKLTPQETRNALYNGKFNRLCIRLAENEKFRKMWRFPLENEVEGLLLKSEDELKDTNYSSVIMNSYRKMDDVELALRFFAYRHIEQMTSPVDKFLDIFLKHANTYDENTINELEVIFEQTIDLIYSIFGEDAFLLPKLKDVDYKSPTKTIYDAMCQAFARNISFKNNLLSNKEPIKQNLYSKEEILYREGRGKESNIYLFDGRYNNKRDVIARIDYFHNFLQDYIK
jgi:hypothetical protein